MWIFADYGYLLPTITEENDPMRRHKDWNRYSRNGEFTFQVRARLREHLNYYLANFAEPGTYGPIWRTPDHDYNYRVFTTQEAFAEAMKKSIMAIDYRNFKDQSTKYPRGTEYHKLLLSVWSDSCSLNEPGGFYGPKSAENPDGYDAAKRYSGWGSGEFVGRRIGDSFQNIDFGDDRYTDDIEEDEMEWADARTMGIIDDMYRYGIDKEDWPLNLVPSEFESVIPFLRQSFSKKKVKKMRQRNREAFSL